MTYDVTSREALEKAIKHATRVENEILSPYADYLNATWEAQTRLAGLWVAIAAELREQSNPRR